MRKTRTAYVRNLVRACGYALATAEMALAARVDHREALAAISDELTAVLGEEGREPRWLAQSRAVGAREN